MVEVASPTTETIDRRENPLAYKKLPNLTAYLIVDQEGMRVERDWPDASGQSRQAEVPGPEGVVPPSCPQT